MTYCPVTPDNSRFTIKLQLEGVIAPTWVWNATICGDLVEQDTKRPDVGLVGELSVADGLRSAPLVGNLLIFCDVERLLGDKFGVETAGLSELDYTRPFLTLITLARPKSATLQV